MGIDNFVDWDDRYSLGIPLIDAQHKRLIVITNDLHFACQASDGKLDERFKEAVHNAVAYVQYHFSTEEKIMEKVKYPDFAKHKKEHNDFVKEILTKVKEFEKGNIFVPISFVIYLRDWVLTHIAITDIKMAAFILEMKKAGKLGKVTVPVKNL
jgi:hemerythrin